MFKTIREEFQWLKWYGRNLKGWGENFNVSKENEGSPMFKMKRWEFQCFKG